MPFWNQWKPSISYFSNLFLPDESRILICWLLIWFYLILGWKQTSDLILFLISTYSLISKLLQTKYCFSQKLSNWQFLSSYQSSCLQRHRTSIFIDTRSGVSVFLTPAAKSSVLGGQMEVKMKDISFFISCNLFFWFFLQLFSFFNFLIS